MEFLEKMFQEAPYIAAQVLTIILFLKYLNKRDLQWDKIIEERDKRFHETASVCHENQEKATEAIIENAKVLTELRVVIDHIDRR